MKKPKCNTCQGDKKIMQSTGDSQHPLQAIPCPQCSSVKVKLTKAVDRLERLSNKNNHGHGEFACFFCDARGAADIEHSEICPIGELWALVNGEL